MNHVTTTKICKLRFTKREGAYLIENVAGASWEKLIKIKNYTNKFCGNLNWTPLAPKNTSMFQLYINSRKDMKLFQHGETNHNVPKPRKQTEEKQI
jgi:hypothetical protein